MKNVLVALWSYKSRLNYGSPPMGAVKSLTDKVQATAVQLAASKDIESQNPFQAIFMAPEYIFVGPRSTQTRGVMNPERKDEIVSALVGISKANPEILIIAGSTFWAETLDTEDKGKKYKANLIAAAMKATDFGKKKDADVLKTWTQSSTGKSIPGLDDLARVVPKFRAYNTVHAFLNGQSAFAPYNKECDFLEADGANPELIAYVPGSAGGLREVGKFQFGLEVCFDHQENNLKGKKADFHVVVSDWAQTHPNQCIGGYLMHASSNEAQTGVWKSGDNTKLTAVNNQVPSAGSLNYWLVPIEARP